MCTMLIICDVMIYIDMSVLRITVLTFVIVTLCAVYKLCEVHCGNERTCFV